MNLHTQIAGIDLENPLMPASGPLVGDDKKILSIAAFGVGGIVTKTISTNAAQVPRPCIYSGKNFIMNAELWSEFSAVQWIEEFLPAVKQKLTIPLLISVGYKKEDMKILIPKLDSFADAFEISTHYVGKDLQVIAEIVKTIRSCTHKPFFMKMSPHISDPVAFAKTVLENGANGVVAINSLGPTMSIDLQHRKVKIGNVQGEAWTSGPVVKPLALAIVHRIKKEVPNCTVIGVGGISTAENILEFLLAGADAVQMLSGAMLYGKDLYKKLIVNLPKALEKYGFNNIQQVRDASLEIGTVRFNPQYPKVDSKRCTMCKLCERCCPYSAIESQECIIIHQELCFGCGLCQSRCPVGAIEGVFLK